MQPAILKKTYGTNGLGKRLGTPTKNELANLSTRLAAHKARMDELIADGMDRSAASKKAFDELVQS